MYIYIIYVYIYIYVDICNLFFTRPLEGSCKLELIKFDDPRGRDTFWQPEGKLLY